MNLRKASLLFVTAAAITLPGVSFANSMWHSANGEVGVTYHPDHSKSTTTRAQVIAELDAARKDGTLAMMQRGAPVPAKITGPGKTRAQVLDEMRNESGESRRARMELLLPGG